jgi:hypothetical protein
VRDKLTDINLLKRHVLKRCIYGVDLNPMAVELAKVSLWLDAFTLGAPLSFLNHHLRCGNSLIGSSIRDLENIAEGRLHLEKIRGKLRIAIENMLKVSRIADATASQAAESAAIFTSFAMASLAPNSPSTCLSRRSLVSKGRPRLSRRATTSITRSCPRRIEQRALRSIRALSRHGRPARPPWLATVAGSGPRRHVPSTFGQASRSYSCTL